MAPYWVKNTRDYAHWVSDCVDQSGGEIQGTGLGWERVVDWQGVTVGLSIPQHQLRLVDGRFLNFFILGEVTPLIVAELDYSFHCGDSEASFQWRACQNDHRVYSMGTRYHLHSPTKAQGRPADWVEITTFGHIDLDEAIAAMLESRLPAPQSNDD